MKLLAVTPYFPSPNWGSGARSFYVLKALAKRYRISLVTQVSQEELETVVATSPLHEWLASMRLLSRSQPRSRRQQQVLNFLRGRSTSISDHTLPGLQMIVDDCLAQGDYQALYFDCALSAHLSLPRHMPVIILQHNIEYELLQRTYRYEHNWLRKWYNWREYRLVRPFELRTCRRADVVLVTSERERLLLRELLPQKMIEVVPNGVDVEYFRGTLPRQEARHRLVFTGSMDYYPNIDAVLFFARVCWPSIRERVPDAEWQIVGKNPPAAVWRLGGLPGVTVTGSVPDVRPYLQEATVTIVPLQIGSGTRLKILEALAMGKAVVSTSLGAEGLALVSGRHLWIEDEPEAFARRVVELFHDPEQRASLGSAGRSLVEEEYSWQRCERDLLALLEHLDLGGARPDQPLSETRL